MVWLDGFTQLHLFHSLVDNEVYFYNEKSLAIKLHCQKAFTECAWEEDTRGLPNRIGSPRLNHQTFLRFSFTNTADFFGPISEAPEPFTNVRGRRGRWGAHRTPSQAYSTQISQNVVCIVCETKSCLLACNLNSVRIVHYQIFDVHK